MTKLKPSIHQKKIFEFLKKGKGNAIINAVAGSGKTTTLLMGLDYISKDKSVLFTAFNKHIAEELLKRIPSNREIDVKTIHGLGFNTLTNYFDPKIDNSKYRKLTWNIINSYNNKNDLLLKDYNFDTQSKKYITLIHKLLNSNAFAEADYVPTVVDLCNLSRLFVVDTDIKAQGFNDIRELVKRYSLNVSSEQVEFTWYLIKLGIFYHKVIDYTDMIFLPLVFNYQVKKYDFIFLDEAQDVSKCQRMLVLKAMNPTSRIVGVGDEKQAIYSFAGADYDSFKALTQIPNTIQLPLTVTYRCAEPIVQMVKHLNPIIAHYEKNTEGTILKDFSYKNLMDGDMVLCRQTFPIVAMCIKLLSEGRKATVIGSDIGLALKNMILDTERKREEFTMKNVFSRLYTQKEKLITKLMDSNMLNRGEAEEEQSVIIYNEKIMVIEALANGLEDPYDVIAKIVNLFSDNEKTGIILSNIHKSKGLEVERVFMIHNELIPSKYAKLPWELQQERNLIYVAYTRAKHTLGFINDYNAFDDHISLENETVPVLESKHIGSVGMKMNLHLKVLDIKSIKTSYGNSVVYEMIDNEGNYFSKFGEISDDFAVDKSPITIGSMVLFYAIIKEHALFKGNKINKIGKIMKY